MKKILGIALLLCAFTQTSFAQKTDKLKETVKVKPQEPKDAMVEAKKNTVLLGQVVTLTATDEENFTRLFEYKHKILNENVSEERKQELARIIEAKIRATLSYDQMTKLDAKPEVLSKLKS
jgi:hypothetical protein